MAYNLLFTLQMEKLVVTTTAVSVIDFTILEKGFSNIIKAKVIYYNKTNNNEKFKVSPKQYIKYIKCLQPQNEKKYSIYTPKCITKHIKIYRTPPPKKKKTSQKQKQPKFKR